MDVFDKIIRENCWKFNKGYPDSQEDINYLKLKINNLVLEQDEYDGKQTFQVVVSYGGDIQMLDGKIEKQEEKPADLPVDGVPF